MLSSTQMQAARRQQCSRYPDRLARFGKAITGLRRRSVTPLQRASRVRRSAAPNLTPECGRPARRSARLPGGAPSRARTPRLHHAQSDRPFGIGKLNLQPGAGFHRRSQTPARPSRKGLLCASGARAPASQPKRLPGMPPNARRSSISAPATVKKRLIPAYAAFPLQGLYRACLQHVLAGRTSGVGKLPIRCIKSGISG